MASIRQNSAPRFRRGAVDSYFNSPHSAFPFELPSLVYRLLPTLIGLFLLPTLVGLFRLPTLRPPLKDGADDGPRLPKRRANSGLDLLEMEDANDIMLVVGTGSPCSLRRLRADAQEFLLRRSTLLLQAGRRSVSSPPPCETTSGDG